MVTFSLLLLTAACVCTIVTSVGVDDVVDEENYAEISILLKVFAFFLKSADHFFEILTKNSALLATSRFLAYIITYW